MEKILTKKALPQWLKKLNAYQIYAPVKKENHWSYEVIDKPESIRLDHLNTIESPKKIIFPQREVFFEFHSAEGNSLEMKEPASEPDATVIFGIRPCDAIGVAGMQHTSLTSLFLSFGRRIPLFQSRF